jgi:hypothetical protein
MSEGWTATQEDPNDAKNVPKVFDSSIFSLNLTDSASGPPSLLRFSTLDF